MTEEAPDPVSDGPPAPPVLPPVTGPAVADGAVDPKHLPTERAAGRHEGPRQSRVIGVILVSIFSLPLAALGGVLAALIAVAILAVTGTAENFQDHPSWLFAAMIGTEATFLIVAVAAGSTSSGGLRQRLRLTTPRVPRAAILFLMLGTLFVWFLGFLFYRVIQADAWLSPVDESFAMLGRVFGSAPMGWKIALVIAGSVGPGICEEFLFRGYLQTRLLERWSPPKAIFVSGTIFALAHFDPHHVLGILPLCFWLGYVAFRTGSIVPGILCHMFVNAIGQTMLASMLITSEGSEWTPVLVAGLVGLPAFAIGVRWLERTGRLRSDTVPG